MKRLDRAVTPVCMRKEPMLVHAFLRARNMSEPASKSFDAIIAAIQSLASTMASSSSLSASSPTIAQRGLRLCSRTC